MKHVARVIIAIITSPVWLTCLGMYYGIDLLARTIAWGLGENWRD